LQAQEKYRSKEESREIKMDVNGSGLKNVYGIGSEFV